MSAVPLNKPLYDVCCELTQIGYHTCFRGEIGGLENIPREGPFILAANHLSFLDPPAIGSNVPRRLVYFARKSLFKPGLPRWWLTAVGTVAVDRDAGSDVSALRRVIGALKDGRPMILFPEGTRSEDGRLQPAKAGVGLIACKTQVPVLPTRVFGSFEVMGRHRKHPKLFSPIHVGFGAAMLPAEFDPGGRDKERYQIAADRIMLRIAAITLPPRPAV